MSPGRASERRRERRRTLTAALFSLFAHLFVILLVAWLYLASAPPAPPPEEEIEITFVEPPPAAQQRFVDTTAPESAPSEQAPFEADRNTAAASPDAAQGEAPVPTQEGEEQPIMELETQQLAMAAPAPAPPAPESPPAEPAPATTPPPEPPAEESIEDKPDAQIEPDGMLARTEPVPEKDKPQPTPPPPPALPPSRPAFQRQARATRLRGSLSNRGRPSVEALATPLGRYRKAITDAIGSSWYYYIGSRMDMFSYGTVSVVFLIDRDGKVRNPRVLSNTSNESFEIVTLESILAAEIPPIPPDVLPTLDNGQIEIDFNFSIITN